MEDSFYFSLLRISIAQILKTQGFDKCKPSTLNILTSLYIDYLNKLTSESIACSSIRTRTNTPEVQDVMQAMLDLGLVKATQSNKIHDAYFDESEYNTKSVNSFHNWVMSYYGDQIRNIARRKKQKDIEEEKVANVAQQSDNQQQSIYQQFVSANNLSSSKKQRNNKGDDEEVGDGDIAKSSLSNAHRLKWLNHLFEKELKLGHKFKYLYATEFIANEFEEDLLRNQAEVRRGSTDQTLDATNDNDLDLDLDLQSKIKRIRNNEWNNFMVKPITKGDNHRREDGVSNAGGIGAVGSADDDVNELVKKEADLEKYLPYKIKYPEVLVSDDVEVAEVAEDDEGDSADVDMTDPTITTHQPAEI
ncbi:hypothetical protein KGF57_005229 [Candida theae]|uniref:Bromodomain associated domain-containing protein n=1 Tax=Candida theae TaxID=1198502 RepID=A0AAD5BAB9_9ASCO|nr:uncharacterized protein KGF57_005229 [Candida theae]KAI5948831.1 hypothetical protein KGF57_005229 [Candida theae]